MKRFKKKIFRLIAGAVLLPLLLWVLVVLCLPMEWARNRVVASLQDATHQHIGLKTVRIGLFGGVTLTGLEFASTKNPDDPWLKIESMMVDVYGRDLLSGTITPTDCRIMGMDLRIRRDASGRLEFEDLLKSNKVATPGSPGSESAPTMRELAFRIEDARILLDDRATDTRLEFTEVTGLGTDDGNVANLSEMTGRVNDGTFTMAARAERTPMTTLTGQIQSQDVALGVGTKALAYFVPLVAGMPDGPQAQGTLTFDLDLHAQGETTDSLVKTLSGRGSVALDGLTLDDSRVIAEVTKLLPVPTQGRLGSLRGDFQIANRRVTTSNTVLRIADVPVQLSGWSDLDGHLDYRVKCDKLGKTVSNLARKLPPEARDLLEDLPVEELGGLADLQVVGTLDRLVVRPSEGSILAKTAKKSPARRADDRAKLKAVGKKLLDRVIR